MPVTAATLFALEGVKPGDCPRWTLYAITPVLSLDADQVRCTWFTPPVAVTFCGTEGACVSTGGGGGGGGGVLPPWYSWAPASGGPLRVRPSRSVAGAVAGSAALMAAAPAFSRQSWPARSTNWPSRPAAATSVEPHFPVRHTLCEYATPDLHSHATCSPRLFCIRTFEIADGWNTTDDPNVLLRNVKFSTRDSQFAAITE